MAEAEKEFDKASKRLENNAEAYYDLGNALQSQQKFEEALSAYQKSLETGKTTENLRSKIFHNMGNSFAGLGKYQDAEKFYMKSLEEEPSKESAENLEIVRRIIAQQKEQEEQQKQQQQNQDKQENQDQQDQENQEQNLFVFLYGKTVHWNLLLSRKYRFLKTRKKRNIIQNTM